MKKTLIIAAIVFVIVAEINIIEISTMGGFISKKTEQKYIRNFPKYERNDQSHSDQIYINNAGDSLSHISTNTFDFINVFSKYHIADVGLIKRGSRLHNMLDSFFLANPPKENNYK